MSMKVRKEQIFNMVKPESFLQVLANSSSQVPDLITFGV